MHDSLRRGFSDSFEAWAAYEERWNYQVKSLAGRADLEEAKRILTEKFRGVGDLDDYDGLMRAVRSLSPNGKLDVKVEHLNRAGLTKGGTRSTLIFEVEEITDYHRALAAERNTLDNALHRFVREELIHLRTERLEAAIGALLTPVPIARWQAKASTAFRNLVRKPAYGYCPGAWQALPMNAVNVKEYCLQNGQDLPRPPREAPNATTR